ncbi:hypothetical protein AVEN_210055-1, partial [Araneus ventricosus]
ITVAQVATSEARELLARVPDSLKDPLCTWAW